METSVPPTDILEKMKVGEGGAVGSVGGNAGVGRWTQIKSCEEMEGEGLPLTFFLLAPGFEPMAGLPVTAVRPLRALGGIVAGKGEEIDER